MATGLIEHPPYKIGSITKARFLSAAVCPTAGWWDTHYPLPKPRDEATRFHMEQGRRVHELARARFPGAIAVETLDVENAVRQTQSLIDTTGVHAIVEAAFAVEAIVARPDVIVRERDGTWRVIEIKSGTSVKPDRLQDLAYTVMVARRARLHVTRATLMLLNPDYRARQGDDTRPLFVEHDCTEQVDQIITEDLAPRWDPIAFALDGPQPPEPRWRWACGRCPYFDTRCLGRGIEHPVFELPRLREGAWRTIMRTGARGIRGIPASALDGDAPNHDQWRHILDATRTGEPWVSDELAATLATLQWPAYCLDFETVSFFVPFYAGTRPHQQVPTQYSLHVLESPEVLKRCNGLSVADGDGVDGVTHSEFLAADASADCRRELLERMLDDLGDHGSIVVYSRFEEGRLHELKEAFPEFAVRIDAVVARLFDLCQVLRDQYYDPGFHGSYSIKRVLPVLAPDLSYEALGDGVVKEGGGAAALFARAAQGELPRDRWAALRAELLEYCKLDTWAMVRVLGALSGT